VIVAAVTDDARAAPISYVPAVDADQMPTYVVAVDPGVVTVTVATFEVDPEDGTANVAEPRVVVISEAPVVDGDAECAAT
jgi:hypothetical protein